MDAFHKVAKGLFFTRGFEKSVDDVIKTFKHIDQDEYSMEKVILATAAAGLLLAFPKTHCLIYKEVASFQFPTDGLDTELGEAQCGLTIGFVDIVNEYSTTFLITDKNIYCYDRSRK